MIEEIKIFTDCKSCKIQFDLNKEGGLFCTNCIYSFTYESEIEETLLHVASKNYHWEDGEFYKVFKNQEEKEIFLKGIKYGYASALFWIADGFSMVKFFEDYIGHNFENIKNRSKVDE
jgi:hypothetical protein